MRSSSTRHWRKKKKATGKRIVKDTNKFHGDSRRPTRLRFGSFLWRENKEERELFSVEK